MIALDWNAMGIAWLVSGLFNLALAVPIYVMNPRDSATRRVSFQLFGTGILHIPYATYFMAQDASLAYAAQTIVWLVLPIHVASFLLFLAVLRTPVVRPIRGRASTNAILASTVVACVAYPLWKPYLFVGLRPFDLVPWLAVEGPAAPIIFMALSGLMVYSLVAAVSAFRRAPTGWATYERTRILTYGFVARAATYLAVLPLAAVVWFDPFWVAILIPIGGVVHAALFAYGIVKTQLFDIDLRIKLALRKSTVAAIFITTFFVVSELGVAFFEDRTQSQVLGILSTGLLVFAIAPLQRVAERFSNTAMPGVRSDDAYLDAKKLEVYQAALEEALEDDGTITHTQTGYLARLRKRLDISDRDHALLQQALVNTRRSDRTGDAYQAGTVVLGRYRVHETLGKGAHGTTYLAHDEQLDRNVVLKALPAHGEDPERILREARATCQLNDPHVVTVHDVERVGDDVYIVMEHVDGGSLAERVERGPLDETRFRRVAIDLVQALHAVHESGGVHRDVKPANVLLTSKGRAKLADFGIASLPGHEATVGIAGAEGAIGTVRYMSPEQAKGQLVDHRSDLYSAAVTLYEALTGSPYVERRKGESAIETQMRVARSTDPAADRLDPVASPPMRAWFARALAPAPSDRFDSAASMLATLPSPGTVEPESGPAEVT